MITIQWFSSDDNDNDDNDNDYDNDIYPDGESKITEPHHAGDKAEEVESTLLSTGNLPILWITI